MRKFTFIFILFGLMALINAPASRGQNTNSPSAQLKANSVIVDNRTKILKEFFKQYNSPLTDYADEFIKAADAYDLDWRLLASITGVESTYGKFIPQNSFNAYGWNNGLYSFKSWPDSIWYVSKALKEKYIDRGADTVDKIGRIYAPPSPFWAGRVMGIMDNISSEPLLTLDL